MDKRSKVFICAAASYWFLLVAAIVGRSRKRKRVARREGISYAPMAERGRKRIEYLNDKIWRDDTTCVNMLRMNKARFFRFCRLFRDRALLEDTVHMCVEQQVAMFLHTVGHNVRNRVIATNFGRSGETVSRYFNKVLHAIGELREDYIRPLHWTLPLK
jgi:hypothetical protein